MGNEPITAKQILILVFGTAAFIEYVYFMYTYIGF